MEETKKFVWQMHFLNVRCAPKTNNQFTDVDRILLPPRFPACGAVVPMIEKADRGPRKTGFLKNTFTGYLALTSISKRKSSEIYNMQPKGDQ